MAHDSGKEELFVAMNVSSPAQQYLLQSLTEDNVLARDSSYSPLSESCATKKRNFKSSFPHLSPTRDSKRFRSHSPVRSVGLPSDCTVHGTVYDTVHKTVYESRETEQAQPTSSLQAGLIKEETSEITTPTSLEDIGHCRNEICRHIESIKNHTPDGQIDGETTKIIVNELMNLMAVNDLATPEEIAKMRSIFFTRDEVTPSAQFTEAVSRPTTSPLTEPISPLSPLPVLSAVFSAVVDGVTAGYETRSTQTKPATANPNGRSLDVPITYHTVSDTELWKRELESIRRPEPLVAGSYKTVTVPLRSTNAQPTRVNEDVAASTLNSVKNNPNPNPVPEFQSGSRPVTRSGTAIRSNQKREDCDVISVPDTDDEFEYIPSRTSHRVGGGGLIYRGNGEAEYVSSNEEEQQALFNHNISIVEAAFAAHDGADDLPDYDTDTDENIQHEEEVRRFYQPMVRYDDSVDDEEDYEDAEDYGDDEYQDEEDATETPHITDHLVPATRLQNRGRTTHERTAVTYTRDTTGRERSRSPRYSRAEYSGWKPYRENRHYNNRYTAEDSSAGIHSENPYVYAKPRYIRDDPERSSFYGYSANAGSTKAANNALRYQDRLNDVGDIPGPKSSLRLKLDDYVRDSGINKNVVGLEERIGYVLKETFYGSETLDEEQAFHRSWLENGNIKLYKGFPLVEDIGFVCVGNDAKPAGDCYWRALAYNLQGKSARWDLIKAEHLEYLHHVLTDKTHPRHELYAGQLNTQFFLTHGPVLSHGSFLPTREFKANLWQLLHMPHCWTPGVMQQITADLYNIHLVTFTYDTRKNLCSEVSVRGTYNSRHVFMLFTNGNHFQPLTPNEYLG